MSNYFLLSFHTIQYMQAIIWLINDAALNKTFGLIKKTKKTMRGPALFHYLYTADFHTLYMGSCLCSPRPGWSRPWNERGGPWIQSSAPPGRSADRCSTTTKQLNGSPLQSGDKTHKTTVIADGHSWSSIRHSRIYSRTSLGAVARKQLPKPLNRALADKHLF